MSFGPSNTQHTIAYCQRWSKTMGRLSSVWQRVRQKYWEALVGLSDLTINNMKQQYTTGGIQMSVMKVNYSNNKTYTLD